jgi:hypothetical protein
MSRGFGLIEMITATALALIVILAIGQVDVTRVRLSEEVRKRGALEPALALAHMANHLKQADRINLVSPTNVQFRVPLGTNFDVADNYQWHQYKLDGTTLQFCTGDSVDAQFSGITALDIHYEDVEPLAPPGGDPFDPAPEDNNVLEFVINDINDQYRSEVTIRAGAYTNFMMGLAPAGTSDPPGGC